MVSDVTEPVARLPLAPPEISHDLIVEVSGSHHDFVGPEESDRLAHI